MENYNLDIDLILINKPLLNKKLDICAWEINSDICWILK
jgi:hypothetical protein